MNARRGQAEALGAAIFLLTLIRVYAHRRYFLFSIVKINVKKATGSHTLIAKVRKPMAPPGRVHPDLRRYSRPREKSRLRREGYYATAGIALGQL
jgi:hypothetical protein